MVVPNITLKPSGQKVAQVGFGLWKVPNDSTSDVVYNAIKTGYRHFDGACDYGNEKEAGEGIRRAIKDGLVKREDIFVTTKLWATFHSPEHVEQAAKKQLGDWGLEYFDLYLIHFPLPLQYVDPAERYPPGWSIAADKWETKTANIPLATTWKAMESLVDAGLVKNIGLCNCQGGLLLDLLRSARIPPAMLQIEHHPYLVQPQLLDLCKDLGIAVTAYSSFGPLSYRDLQTPKALGTALLFENDVITSTAKKHRKSPAQILLKWAVQRGVIVIPKSADTKRQTENMDVFSFDLSSEELSAISSLDKGLRFNDPVSVTCGIVIVSGALEIG
ncbi:alcohol dehydrogenase [Capronia coronata CBS 617.96]|uniref:D-xylose reductase [NAD(P)H] n=1 Tax=Capronia coronata CBS 617.96 TaxID=1182541 RepID=W9YU99_9EURO|nr:alcohol dehydrogenase [Capronia coronata CBS 617.96]EXJ85839.1 alcohol dehydrogenase [Capronia coronata CBS 617.96]